MIRKNKIIDKISPHTVKKFELIEKYTETWAQKLLNNSHCETLLFVDCMCNSGEYIDREEGKQIFGTPVRVARILRKAAKQYPNKNIVLCFNDFDEAKILHLKELIGESAKNFSVYFTVMDVNRFLEMLWNKLKGKLGIPYLLVYDPYKAAIGWEAITPFLNKWGEVIINHMVFDSIRAMKMAKKPEIVEKYENTYLRKIKELLPYGSDKAAFEKRIEEIIRIRRNNKNKYYIAAVPFFNSRSSLVYQLIHCTSSLEGFKLYKKCAWKTFGGRSSSRDTHGRENEPRLNLGGNNPITIAADDELGYTIADIAEYLQGYFGDWKDGIPLEEVWKVLEEHPVFPSEGFRTEIRKALKDYYNIEVHNRKFCKAGKK